MGWNIRAWLFGDGGSSRARRYEEESRRLRQDLANQTRIFQSQYQQSVNDAKVRQASYEKRTNALNDQLGQLRIDSAAQAKAYEAQLTETRETNAAQVQGLNDLIIQNKEAYDTQAAALTTQVNNAQAAAEKQAKISANLGRAYVPEAQQAALSPSLNQGAVEPQTRRKKDNELSELSIVSSPANSTMAKQLAGLQIA